MIQSYYKFLEFKRRQNSFSNDVSSLKAANPAGKLVSAEFFKEGIHKKLYEGFCVKARTVGWGFQSFLIFKKKDRSLIRFQTVSPSFLSVKVQRSPRYPFRRNSHFFSRV